MAQYRKENELGVLVVTHDYYRKYGCPFCGGDLAETRRTERTNAFEDVDIMYCPICEDRFGVKHPTILDYEQD